MIRKKTLITKSLALIMALSVTATNIPVNLISTVTGSDVDDMSIVQASGKDYGLADEIEDGVILHAWNWSFDQIKEELPKIAEAGFTAVQTSPAQPNKDGDNVSDTSRWWKFYQPTDFTIGNKLGSKADLTELCEEADKYGIKIIVDVVANHLANNTGKEGNSASDRSTQIPAWIRNNDDFWHSDNYSGSSDSDRYQMTRGPIGMPDLNTGNKELQDYIIKYLNDLQDCGVDGFRFDAAKHIETPSDTGFSSKFWSRVEGKTKAKDENVFLYGEILNTAGPGGYSDVQKYTKYIKVTNNLYGHNIQSSVANWDASKAKNLSGYNSSGDNIFGTDGNKWVLWNESHDTYAGNYGDSTRGYSDEQMLMAWCAVAARYSTALYFVRPTGGEDNWGSSELGSHQMTYTSKRIGAMNRFHNYFAGQKEYASTSDNVLVVERGTTGVALINYNRGSKKVSIEMHRMVDGTYTDQISGTTFTVSDGVLTGEIASGGVAAIYNPEPVDTDPEVTISKEGGNFSKDTLELTIDLKNATSGTYQIGDEEAKTYTSATTITIGADMACGDSVTVTLTATDETDTCSKTYTFTKVEKKANIAYLSLPSGWGSTVLCYAYDNATGKIHNADWPGLEMTIDEETGYYMYEIPETIEQPRVIFYNSGENRMPGSGEKGLLFEEDGSYLYKDGQWGEYEKPAIPGTVTIKYVDEAGNEIAESTTITGTVGEGYVTAPEPVDGYEIAQIPSNAEGTYTNELISVIYVYKVKETSCTHTETEVRNAKDATCKEAGNTGDTYCKDCDTLLEPGSEIAKTEDHSWDGGTVTKQPTTIEDGIKTFTCKICGTEKTEVIEKLGENVCKHNNTEIRNAKDATCKEAGNTGDVYCKDCGNVVSEGKSIPTVEHSWDNGTVTKQPTATETGIRTYTCGTCGEVCEVEIFIDDICAHSDLVIKNKKSAGCEETGYTGDAYCGACDKKIASGNVIPVLGHTWNDGVITKEPTVTQSGVKRYTCENCGKTEEEEVPPIECNHGETEVRNAKAATCTEGGETGELYCVSCNTLLHASQSIEALGHNWDNGVITVEATETLAGTKTYTCVTCSAKIQEEIPATGMVEDANTPNDVPDHGAVDGAPDNNIPNDVKTIKTGDLITDNSSNGTYKVISTTAKTVEYAGTVQNAETVVIPQTITIDGTNYKVTSIAGNAFKGNKTVKSITIGLNIKNIPANAFKDCINLKKVVIGKNVTKIGARAFYNCKKLARIIIPDKIKRIGAKAFYGCKRLKKIAIKTTKLTNKKVGKLAFKGIHPKAVITLPAKKVVSYKKILKRKGVSDSVTFKSKKY